MIFTSMAANSCFIQEHMATSGGSYVVFSIAWKCRPRTEWKRWNQEQGKAPKGAVEKKGEEDPWLKGSYQWLGIMRGAPRHFLSWATPRRATGSVTGKSGDRRHTALNLSLHDCGTCNRYVGVLREFKTGPGQYQRPRIRVKMQPYVILPASTVVLRKNALVAFRRRHVSLNKNKFTAKIVNIFR